MRAYGVVDGLTGNRADTVSLLHGGRWPGGSSGGGRVILAQAVPMDGSTGMPLPPIGAIPKPGAGAGAAVAGAVVGAIDRWREYLGQQAVQDALQKFGLSASDPADVSAAYAYAYMMHNGYNVFWRLPIGGPELERVAQCVMRHERALPGTLARAIAGIDDGARTLIDSWVDEGLDGAVVGDEPVERRSDVAPSLSEERHLTTDTLHQHEPELAGASPDPVRRHAGHAPGLSASGGGVRMEDGFVGKPHRAPCRSSGIHCATKQLSIPYPWWWRPSGILATRKAPPLALGDGRGDATTLAQDSGNSAQGTTRRRECHGCLPRPKPNPNRASGT